MVLIIGCVCAVAGTGLYMAAKRLEKGGRVRDERQSKILKRADAFRGELNTFLSSTPPTAVSWTNANGMVLNYKWCSEHGDLTVVLGNDMATIGYGIIITETYNEHGREALYFSFAEPHLGERHFRELMTDALVRHGFMLPTGAVAIVPIEVQPATT